MLATLRYRKGLGNAAVYVRVRSASAQFWDFTGLAWVATDTVMTQVMLLEYADADALESRYQAAVTLPPTTDVIVEYVLASNSSVLAEEGPGLLTAEVAAARTAAEQVNARLPAIPASYGDVAASSAALSTSIGTVQSRVNVLLEAADPRLDRLDTAVSTRLAAADSRLDRLDVTVSTRLPATDPRLDRLDAAVSTRLGATDLRLDRLDAAVSTRLAAVDYTPADNAGISTLSTLVTRGLALAGANTVRDQEVLDTLGRTVSGRIRSYDSAANALLAGSAGLLATYTVTARYDQAGACTLIVTESVP